jgi:hypothetical protein
MFKIKNTIGGHDINIQCHYKPKNASQNFTKPVIGNADSNE